MQVGLMAPQGWKGEYDGWRAGRRLGAHGRAREAGRGARLRVALGLRSLPHRAAPTEEITFESFSVLSALAMATERVRLGHMVVCTGFRNPALTAKMSSTIDVISGGRFELGIGAGWKEEEWRAYGYGFPTLGERMAALGDHLEVIHAMFAPGRASYEGRVRPRARRASTCRRASRSRASRSSSAATAQRVTAGLRDPVRRRAELRLPRRPRSRRADGRRSGRAARPRAAIRRRSGSRCTPATRSCATPGQARVDLLAGFAAIGLDRIICFPTRWSPTTEAQAAFAEDCRGGRA